MDPMQYYSLLSQMRQRGGGMFGGGLPPMQPTPQPGMPPQMQPGQQPGMQQPGMQQAQPGMQQGAMPPDAQGSHHSELHKLLPYLGFGLLGGSLLGGGSMGQLAPLLGLAGYAGHKLFK